MPRSDFLPLLLSSASPKNQRLLAARGLFPLPPGEMVELLVRLLHDEDPDVAEQAGRTVEGWADDEIVLQLQSSTCSPYVLDYFASTSSSQSILQAIALNPSTPSRSIEIMALTAQARILQIILENRARILESPGILENAKRNPSATSEIRGIVHEIEAEFFRDKKTEYQVETGESADQESELLQLYADVAPDSLALEGLPLGPEEREEALTERLSKMSIRDKIQHALFGSREMRAILIRNPNRQVARSVLRSPKLLESEIEAISTMRNVAEEILGELGNNKEWTRNYNVVHNLVDNPKTPLLVAQRLMPRLYNRDLTHVARDRGVPEAVRRHATRILSQRQKSKPC